MSFLEQPEKMPTGLKAAVISTIKEENIEAGVRVIAIQQNCSMEVAEDYLVAAGLLEVAEEELSEEELDEGKTPKRSVTLVEQSDGDSDNEEKQDGESSQELQDNNKTGEESKTETREEMLAEIASLTSDNPEEPTEEDKAYMAEVEKLDDDNLAELLKNLRDSKDDEDKEADKHID